MKVVSVVVVAEVAKKQTKNGTKLLLLASCF